MMELYPKINSIFKRDDKGRFTCEYSCPEFEYLKNNEWVFTEKIDGTNIRIGWEDGKITIGGRTERAQIPAHLFDYLAQTFTADKFSDFENVILFGEGYGQKINGGEQYIPNGVGFILFDVKVGRWWLKREDIEKIAEEFGVPVVPIVETGRLIDATEIVQGGYMSLIADCKAEGFVLRPKVDLIMRGGERIITKVKTKDYRK